MSRLCWSIVFTLFAVLFISQVASKKKCGTARWKWPHDFKLLSSKDALWEFMQFQCYTFRDSSLLQNGKYFCWRKKEALPPIEFISIWEGGSKGLMCKAMPEPLDLTYRTMTFCTTFPLGYRFKVYWHHCWFGHGYDAKKCIRFNRLRLIGDVWQFNYLCGERIVFEKEYCIDE